MSLRPRFEEKLHPRARGGKFAAKPGGKPGKPAKPQAPKAKPGKLPRYNAATAVPRLHAVVDAMPSVGKLPASQKKQRALKSDKLEVGPMADSVAARFDQAEPWMHETGAQWYPGSLEW